MKPIKMTTGKGIAMYPWLFTPDTKFSTEGVYSLTLRMSGEAGEQLRSQIKDMLDKFLNGLEATTGKRPSKLIPLPIKEAHDEQGNEVLDFKFKMNPSFKGRDGKQVIQRPFVVDAQLQPLTEESRVGSGSTVKVNFSASPYSISAGTGIAFRLVGVQVLDLVAWGGDGGGFTVEEGFAAPETPKTPVTETPVQGMEKNVADAANF
tara:strand:+ start:277 stop:894 length:618 start_codon:yes stop_codon:yes gene_type:complete